MTDPIKKSSDTTGKIKRREYVEMYDGIETPIIRLYAQMAADIQDKINAYADKGGKIPPERLLALRSDIYGILSDMGFKEADLILDRMRKSIEAGAQFTRSDIANQLGLNKDQMGFLFGKVNTDLALALARGDAESRFIYTGNAGGLKLGDAIYNNAARDFDSIMSEIRRRAMTGESAYNVAKAMGQFINDGEHLGYTPWKSAVRLARTEMASAFRAGSVETFNKSSLFTGVKWHLSLSHKPSGCKCEGYAREDSFGLGAGVFPKDALPSLPHPHCLCYWTGEMDKSKLDEMGLGYLAEV